MKTRNLTKEQAQLMLLLDALYYMRFVHPDSIGSYIDSVLSVAKAADCEMP